MAASSSPLQSQSQQDESAASQPQPGVAALGAASDLCEILDFPEEKLTENAIGQKATSSASPDVDIEPAITPALHSKQKEPQTKEGGSDQLLTATSSPGSANGLDVDSNPTNTEYSDADSAVGDSIYSSTYSTSSSVRDFVEENGRTYHRFKEGRYYLPNDEIERDRLDLQHHMCEMSFGSLYLAPLENIPGGLHNVLDIATGTGIWAIEFAHKFPEAVIKGTDLSPIQPDYVPPNCHFEVDDAEDPWIYSHKFDYIHGRMLATCFQSHVTVFKWAFDFLRPGGYIELQDVSLPLQGADMKFEGTALQRWASMIMDASRILGKEWDRVPRYKEYLEEIGFVDVVERKFHWPIGPWAKGKQNKNLGVWARANLLQSLGGLSMAVLTKGMGMTAGEIEVLLVDVRDDINKDGAESLHAYAPLYVVYGRKPQ